MSWSEKKQPSPFDTSPIEGLFFLDGDVLALIVGTRWTEGQKYSMIAFPSGMECSLWESGDPKSEAIVHLFGEMDLAYRSNRDEAFKSANYIGEQCGYAVQQVGKDKLGVWGHTDDEHLLITYDNGERRMVDVERVKGRPEERPTPPALELMNDAIREQLPPLYSNEKTGMNAVAPVKYFTPDGGWTWYASEFDGADTFFGLVSGLEIELGYFSLSELQGVRGSLGLPVERDIYYEPKTLQELMDWHKKQRGRYG